MKKILFTHQGIGLIESILLIALVGISVAGLGAGIQKVGQTRLAVKDISNALAFESGLQAAMQDYSQYSDPEEIEVLQAGETTISNLTFLVAMTNADGLEQNIPIPINTDVFFNSQGVVCPAACSGWTFSVRFEGRRTGGTLFPVYALAYRIRFNPETYSLTNLGATSNTFQTSDFQWMIPPEAYRNNTLSSCDLSSGQVIVTGKDSAGGVNCIQVGDNTTCASNEIATGWVLESGADGSTQRVLKMGCRRLNPSPTCPSLGAGGYDYAVHTIAPSTFSTSPQGQCVFVARASADVSLTSIGRSRTATFDVCPAHYRFQPAAGTVNGCMARVQSTLYGWRDAGCPAGAPGENWIQDVSPASLVTTGVIQNDGRQVVCGSSNDQQILPGDNNWAGYSVDFSVSGTCVLAATEFQNF